MLSSENYSNIVVNDVDRTMKESISSEKVAQVINVEFNKGAGKSLGGGFSKTDILSFN